MSSSSELQGLPVGAVLIAVGTFAVALGVALVLSAGAGLIAGGVLALVFGVDASRDLIPARTVPAAVGQELRAVGEAA